MPKAHPVELRQRAVDLARAGDVPVAKDLGISESCLRRWMSVVDVDDGRKPGLTSDERAELVRLRREKRVVEWRSRSSSVPAPTSPKFIRVTYTFNAERCADLPVEHCCRVMKVSRSAFFAWRQRQANPTIKMADDAELAELIAKIHGQSFGTYGRQRVTAELRLGLGQRVNHKRVARLMREQDLQGITRRRLRGCTRSRVTDPRSDDLVHRQFRPDGPNRLWVQDVTQHRTSEGWVYLAVVIDAWSRRVVGWSIADHMRAELIADAIDMATWRRRPADCTIAHSDHGSNDCS